MEDRKKKNKELEEQKDKKRTTLKVIKNKEALSDEITIALIDFGIINLI